MNDSFTVAVLRSHGQLVKDSFDQICGEARVRLRFLVVVEVPKGRFFGHKVDILVLLELLNELSDVLGVD